MKKLLAVFLGLVIHINSYAFGYVHVLDMSQLSWQMTIDGKVFLRNLNQFEGSFLGCCYSYWVDTSTPAGKSMWNAMLVKIATAKPLYLGLSNPAQGGVIEHIGNW